MTNNHTITPELLDQLLANYEKPAPHRSAPFRPALAPAAHQLAPISKIAP